MRRSFTVVVDCEQFQEIFERLCPRFELVYDAAVVEKAIDALTREFKQSLRACYPTDIPHQTSWSARYEGKKPQLAQDSVVLACRNYFLAS